MEWVAYCEMTQRHNTNNNQGGIVDVLPTNDKEVQSLYIKAGFQRLGFGQAAINHAQEQCNELRLWVFQANTDAQKFYQKLGFEALETTDGQDNDYGLPDIFYLWELPDS